VLSGFSVQLATAAIEDDEPKKPLTIKDIMDQAHKQGLVKRQDPRANLTRRELNNLFVQWKSLKPMIDQCQPKDKLAFAQYRSQIEPLMVNLQVVFAD
jgi:hypothetical protein